MVLQRGFDPYGREIVRRVRVCDEGSVVPQNYGYPPPRYYEPARSGYEDYPPRPVGPIGPRYGGY